MGLSHPLAALMGLGLACLLAVAPKTSLAVEPYVSYESDHSALKVVLPAALKLFAGSTITHSQALFGTPSYGGDKKIVGELLYVTPDASDDGCNPEYPAPASKDGTRMIFLVDRGDCDFVQKMRIAQKKGASAVIIADNVCQCSETENAAIWSKTSTTGRTLEQKAKCDALGETAAKEHRISPAERCERGLPFMADDGTGSDVAIPSFLIDYLDAQPLKDCITSASSGVTTGLLTGTQFVCQQKTKVVVSLEWDLPSTSKKVNWQLWSSSDSEGVFKKAFKVSAEKLKTYTTFTPHYFIWNGEEWGCTIANMCATQCTEGGLYCNPDPDHSLFEGVSGKDVVDENLRELCIWEQASQANNPDLWWDYVVNFANNCHPGAKVDPTKFTKTCSEQAQVGANLDVSKTEKCVADSWASKPKNSKLDQEIKQRATLKILTLPTAIVNGLLLRGGVTTMSILTSICAGFSTASDTDTPKICSCVQRSNSDNLLECINSDCNDPNQKYCSKDKICYSQEDYATACSDLCPKQSDKFCASLSQCLPSDKNCPKCPDSATAFYCPILDKCVSDYKACVPATDTTDKGTSAFGVFIITLVVVSLAGCIAYAFWRRQRARLHDDVRAILSSYMALEENEDSENRVSRQERSARVEPMQSDSLKTGQGSVGGQDAAQYI